MISIVYDSLRTIIVCIARGCSIAVGSPPRRAVLRSLTVDHYRTACCAYLLLLLISEPRSTYRCRTSCILFVVFLLCVTRSFLVLFHIEDDVLILQGVSQRKIDDAIVLLACAMHGDLMKFSRHAKWICTKLISTCQLFVCLVFQCQTERPPQPNWLNSIVEI
jgi:hypothetical protein